MMTICRWSLHSKEDVYDLLLASFDAIEEVKEELEDVKTVSGRSFAMLKQTVSPNKPAAIPKICMKQS